MENKEKKELWQYFFNYPKKHYNIYMEKMTEYPEYIIYDEEVTDSKKNKWNEYFGNENPVYLEIGCGSGNFTAGNAQKFPDRNYIALELRFKRLVMAAVKSEKRDLKNIVFLRKRGEKLLDFLGEGEISGLYINFPDPWTGSEHKRLINKELFDMLDVIMKPKGKFFFKTDHEGYYYDTLELLKDLDGYEIVFHTDDLYNTEKIRDNIQTEFEQMFLSKHNMNIKYIEIIKK
ncbi:tRNA (guanosine(46)-N7)-methyltransferase TrmB [Sebaldella sp. S0638]|uniref:tRNA (guanosine(46)-N7)-methyltransferase TrmB n=1 Tax=Sebaldella sp. S0638 TaxID=2957809 RepID=UPI00209F3951|nr:tRNA (guanosine(46)-N7)-methyltransferase TrmB [Sebaldella sp. S0638]